jgi:nitrile hydratase
MDSIHISADDRASAGCVIRRPRRLSHADWEKRVNALYSLAVKVGVFSMDEYRHAIEAHGAAPLPVGELPRALADEAWRRSSSKGLVTRGRLGGVRTARSRSLRPPLRTRHAATRERFRPGDRACGCAPARSGHVRMPAYIRGKTGVVVSESPAYPFPDAAAHGVASEDEPTYDACASAPSCGRPQPPRRSSTLPFQSYLERA